MDVVGEILFRCGEGTDVWWCALVVVQDLQWRGGGKEDLWRCRRRGRDVRASFDGITHRKRMG